MPPLTNLQQADADCLRVLITGFGPFQRFAVNPSWLAARLLHDVVLDVDPNLHPPDSEAMDISPKSQQIHCQAMMLPVSYESVLAQVPALHARPPVLPEGESDLVRIPPPDDGFDFVIHVGVAGRGPLRMERMAHKTGYRMKDANDKLAPIVEKPASKDGNGHGNGNGSNSDESNHDDSPGRTAQILGMTEAEMANHEFFPSGTVEPVQELEVQPTRGFGKGYESFPEEIYVTDPDVEKLCRYLKDTDGDVYKAAYTSMDAGHFVCDFTYYCSLAEAKRSSALPHHKGRHTRVFFLHCPPVNNPHSTEEVAEAIRRIIIWVCSYHPNPPQTQ